MKNSLKTVFALALLFSSCGEVSKPKPIDTVHTDSLVVKTIPSGDSISSHRSTFDVADVTPAAHLLPTHSAQRAFEERIGKKILAFPEQQQNEMLVPVDMNGFMQAVQYCYAEHRPLIISPDEIWMLLCQGFSIHMNEHFDSLKTKVFKNEKPQEISFRNDSLINGKASEWQKLIDSLSFLTRQYTKQDVFTAVVQDFSTTSPIEQTAFEITLLESQKKAFTYLAESGCGIPQITLKGSTADWKKIDSCMNNFRKFGMDVWIDNLHPLMKEFVAASEGKVNKKFWNGLYKESSFYGAFYLTGWVIKFFPYIKEYYAVDQENQTFRYVPNPYMDGENYCFSKLNTEHFPGGFAKINVLWNVYDPKTLKREERKMEIYAGFLGLRQDSATKALEPIISWAVCNENAKAVERKYDKQQSEQLKHAPDWWSPDMDPKVLAKQAIYSHNTTAKAGKQELIIFLTDTLGQLSKSQNIPLHHIKINFIVTWAGTVMNVKTDANNDALSKKVTEILLHLPKEWTPGKMLGFDEESGTQQFYKVNSKVSIELF